ncbi:MAG: serine/threonine-protein kinase [Gemmatimonadota bacterium]|nr:serine/threonine-protein kinase [Gemmatimonadota bacterium]
MDAARWERVQTLFHDATGLPEPEQRAFLEATSGDDPTLVADVLDLLQEDARGSPLLDRGVSHAAHHVFGGAISTPLPAGEFGAYRLRRLLGEGGMGVVYLAERTDLGSLAAIKILRDASLSPARRERFASEQRTLAQLEHSSIARLYDADTLPDGTPWFVMEYVEGVPLTTYCAIHACPILERLQLFRAVCEAVQHAHRHAVIHRDLKPSNILVKSDGAVKLLDFGIAKQLESLDVTQDQTRTALRLMTPAYAAPEQVRGERLGIHTDVYSLGVVLYELLSDRLPFDLSNSTPGQIEKIITEQEPEKPSDVARKMAPLSDGGSRATSISKGSWADLDVISLTAMHKDPQRRYRTVEALVRDIDHYVDGEPLDARPDTVRYRAGKFVRRNARQVAVAAALLVMIVGLVVFYTVRLAGARDAALAEAEKTEQVSEYLVNLFEAGDPFTDTPDSLDVRTLLRRGTERAEALTGQPEVQAQMLDVLGRVNTMVSEYGRAEPLLRRAVALRRGLTDSPLDLASSLMNLATLHSNTGAYDSAEAAFREAITLREQHLPPDDPQLAASLDALGIALNRQGKYEEAETAYREALRIQQAAFTGPHKELASTLNNLAVNQSDQSDHAGAERYFRAALEMSRMVYGPEHPSTAVDLANLGVVLETRGNFAAADSALSEAVRIKRLKLGNDHSETAFGLSQLGAMLRRKGDYDRAEAALREALDIEGRVLVGNHRNTAFTLISLGQTLQDRGDYAAAEPMLRRSLAIFGVSVGERHPLTAITRCHLAYLMHLKGEHVVAESLFREGLAMLEAILPPDHDQLALNRGKYGVMLTAQSRFAEAESLLVDSYEKLAAGFGADHRDTRLAVSRLVELYEAWNKPERADHYQRAAATVAGGNASP